MDKKIFLLDKSYYPQTMVDNLTEKDLEKWVAEEDYNDDYTIVKIEANGYDSAEEAIINEMPYEYPEDESIDAYYQLTIDAHNGDYITVGNKAINANGYVTEKNILFPNTGETTGYLKKDNLEKECFYLV